MSKEEIDAIKIKHIINELFESDKSSLNNIIKCCIKEELNKVLEDKVKVALFDKSKYIETLIGEIINKQHDTIRNKINSECVHIVNNFLSNNNELNTMIKNNNNQISDLVDKK